MTTDVGGIEDVFEKEGVTIEGYYNLQGYRLNGPTVGFNIIRYSDGTAKKVLIK